MKRQVIGGTRTRIWGIVKTVILFALLLVYMVPFFMVIINAFKTNRTILKEPLKLLEPGGPIFTLTPLIKWISCAPFSIRCSSRCSACC